MLRKSPMVISTELSIYVNVSQWVGSQLKGENKKRDNYAQDIAVETKSYNKDNRVRNSEQQQQQQQERQKSKGTRIVSTH